MTKAEAAAALGITIRTLQRAMADGLIAYTLEPSPAGHKVSFDPAEVEQFRIVREQREHRPAVESAAIARIESTAAVVAEAQRDAFRELVAALRGSQGASLVPVADKLTLTRREAAHLSGLPQREIDRALATGSLPGVKTGAGWRIKRADLVAFVEGWGG